MISALRFDTLNVVRQMFCFNVSLGHFNMTTSDTIVTQRFIISLKDSIMATERLTWTKCNNHDKNPL